METIIVETENQEQAETVKAILKALKVNYTSSDNTEAKKIAENIRQGYLEMQEIEAGRVKPKSLDQMLDEL